MTSKIKVMIVDDSALVRQVVSKALARDAGIEVIATASDPVFAIEKLRTAARANLRALLGVIRMAASWVRG